MGHEIRKYLALLDGNGPLDGEVEIDETLMGGKDPEGRRGRDPKSNETVVFAMLDRESGEVISQTVPDSKAGTLKPIIEAHVVKARPFTPTNGQATGASTRRDIGTSPSITRPRNMPATAEPAQGAGVDVFKLMLSFRSLPAAS